MFAKAGAVHLAEGFEACPMFDILILRNTFLFYHLLAPHAVISDPYFFKALVMCESSSHPELSPL